MDIAVPTNLPTLSEQERQDLSVKPVLRGPGDGSGAGQAGTSKYARGDFEAKAKTYFDERNVVPMLNALLMDLFLHQPADPIDHMLKFLLRHNTLQELSEEHAHTAARVQDRAEEAVQYATRFKLPQLFDEMLSKLLDDAPEDVLRYALSWLRWHKIDFITRHAPLGYRAYMQDRDTAQRERSQAASQARESPSIDAPNGDATA